MADQMEAGQSGILRRQSSIFLPSADVYKREAQQAMRHAFFPLERQLKPQGAPAQASRGNRGNHSPPSGVTSAFSDAGDVEASLSQMAGRRVSCPPRGSLASLGSVLGGARASLAWNNLYLTLKEKDGSKRTLLNRVTGHLVPGKLMAIMGPTGSGKTSLLNVLAGRLAKSSRVELSGEIVLNGRIRDEDDFKRRTAYVMQDDELYAYLTVRETILIAANFALPSHVSDEFKTSLTAEIMQLLGLTAVADTLVGDSQKRGVSGGERKRVHIGSELITTPVAVFLDEPTSGLDSFQALSVMECLSALAETGRSVVAVVHQPRAFIFEMIDTLVLVSKGDIVYFGPCCDAQSYFESLRYICPSFHNPADFFLDLISTDGRSDTLRTISEKRRDRIAKAWKERSVGRNMTALSSSLVAAGRGNLPDTVKIASKSCIQKQMNWFMQFRLLFWRTSIQNIRNKRILGAKLIIALVVGLSLVILYSELEYTEEKIQDRISLLFFLTLNQFAGTAFNVVQIFGLEKVIVMREYASSRYGMGAYYLAKYLSELPTNLVGPCILGNMVYWGTSLNPNGSRYASFLAVVFLNNACGAAFGMFISSMTHSQQIATAAVLPTILIMMLFGGFYINTENIPKWIAWVRFISPMNWCYQALLSNELRGTTFDCETGGPICEIPGEAVLESQGFEDASTARSCLYLLLLLIAYSIGAYVALVATATRYLRPKRTLNKINSVASEVSVDATGDLNVVESGSTMENSEGIAKVVHPDNGSGAAKGSIYSSLRQSTVTREIKAAVDGVIEGRHAPTEEGMGDVLAAAANGGQDPRRSGKGAQSLFRKPSTEESGPNNESRKGQPDLELQSVAPYDHNEPAVAWLRASSGSTHCTNPGLPEVEVAKPRDTNLSTIAHSDVAKNSSDKALEAKLVADLDLVPVAGTEMFRRGSEETIATLAKGSD